MCLPKDKKCSGKNEQCDRWIIYIQRTISNRSCKSHKGIVYISHMMVCYAVCVYKHCCQEPVVNRMNVDGLILNVTGQQCLTRDIFVYVNMSELVVTPDP